MSVTRTVNNAQTGWFKSSKSNDGPNCVEVRFDGDQVLIRDSKYLRDPSNDPAKQPVIAIKTDNWPEFLSTTTDVEHQIPGKLPTIVRHTTGNVDLRAQDGTVLSFTSDEWAAFTAGIQEGEFAAA